MIGISFFYLLLTTHYLLLTTDYLLLTTHYLLLTKVRDQYASRVVGVSSFWGAAPSADYHPITVLGKPDCSTYGECPQGGTARAWASDLSAYPEVGEHLLHDGLVAQVLGFNTSRSTVTLEYHKLYKKIDENWKQCLIDPQVCTRTTGAPHTHPTPHPIPHPSPSHPIPPHPT